jgi:cytochrome c556
MASVVSRDSVVFISAALLCVSAFAAAPPTAPADLLKARHDHYVDLGASFKTVRDNVNAGDKADFAAVQKAADEIHKASQNQQQWFPKGTGPEAGKTRAVPEIWVKPAEFTAAIKMFEERAPKLLAAVQTKDIKQVQSAFREVGGACKNCHDTFRSPEE